VVICDYGGFIYRRGVHLQVHFVPHMECPQE
jgi:hypothetical protein